MASLKDAVRNYWNAQSCGEVYAAGADEAAQLLAAAAARYTFEPYIRDFAEFPSGSGRDVLEIGVGMGADHVEWAKAGPRSLTGVDLTDRAIAFTRRHLALLGLASCLETADAENLPFADSSFDIVYSWGVLHHTPDTPKAIAEVYRVLRPGGRAKVMIYHRQALTGYMLWTRYALLAGRPRRSLDEVYAHHLESPGTKAYSVAEARAMFRRFARVGVAIRLNHGDLLEGAAGARHGAALLAVARTVWPRPLLRAVAGRLGLYLLIDAEKAALTAP